MRSRRKRGATAACAVRLAAKIVADDIERIHKSGRIASLLGVEGGHMIENSSAAIRIFQELGARYLTLTHWDTVEWADAATDRADHDGLTKLGERFVRELNRVGMFVDLSHVSAETMRDALRVTRAPIPTHTAGSPRSPTTSITFARWRESTTSGLAPISMMPATTRWCAVSTM